MLGWRRALHLLTSLAVAALHVDAEDRDPLALHVVLVHVDVRDDQAPGRQVPRGARRRRWLGGGVVLHHHGGLLHLTEDREEALILVSHTRMTNNQ